MVSAEAERSASVTPTLVPRYRYPVFMPEGLYAGAVGDRKSFRSTDSNP